MCDHDAHERSISTGYVLNSAPRGVRSELRTSGYRPRLKIDETPFLCGGFADAEFEDNVLAAPCADGQWCYWWPWIEKIAPVDDVVNVADLIANSMLAMTPDDPGDDDAEDTGAGDWECGRALASCG